jgi:cbb3-type cytochrome oxidase cytochrome c subunit
MGCFVCHKIDYPAFDGLPRPGPSLEKVASKTNPDWAYQWIAAPRDFRPTSWMPHFFFQENTHSAENTERQKAEIASVVTYLWDQSETVSYEEAPAGDSERGRELYETIGCTGCHLMDAEGKRDQYFPQTNRMHGPNLIRTGSKVSSGWLFAWLKDPESYNPNTRMPSLRLTDREAADLVAFLMASRDQKFETEPMPEIDLEIRDELVLEYLQNKRTIEQSAADLAAMSSHQRDVFLGRETVQKYGCWGCHDMSGFEDAKPIGVELTEVGSKPLHQFDFGHVHDVPHTRHDWIRNKLLQPRIWDEGKEEVKSYGELLRMPDFGMSEREANAVMTTVLGFTRESVVASRRAGTSQRKVALAEGRKLITSMNCQGCHLVEDAGHAIHSAMENADLLPPNLAAQGARVQADWLFSYLHDPESVRLRPWLGARMPTFGFTDTEVNTLISYFGAREERQSFASPAERPSSRDLAVGEVAFGMFQCAKCHPAGPQDQSGGVVSAGELAPSLLLARDRLRHDWVASWILQPQSWIAGTRMPSNFIQDQQGEFISPLANAIDAPMFAAQKRLLLKLFEDETELADHLADAEYVTGVLRDHIWWSLRN